MSIIDIGDVVVLMSGGPRMTVENFNGIYCNCVWFVGNNLYRDKFKMRDLRLVKERIQ